MHARRLFDSYLGTFSCSDQWFPIWHVSIFVGHNATTIMFKEPKSCLLKIVILCNLFEPMDDNNGWIGAAIALGAILLVSRA